MHITYIIMQIPNSRISYQACKYFTNCHSHSLSFSCLKTPTSPQSSRPHISFSLSLLILLLKSFLTSIKYADLSPTSQKKHDTSFHHHQQTILLTQTTKLITFPIKIIIILLYSILRHGYYFPLSYYGHLLYLLYEEKCCYFSLDS